MDSRWHEAKRVLLVRLDNLGDVLLCTPAFHAVRQTLPHAELVLLASSVGAQAAELNPDLSGVIVYAAPWMDVWQTAAQDSAREQDLIRHLRASRFDAAIIFTSFRQSSLPAAYLCYLADIHLRLGASIDGSGSLLTTRHRHPDRMMHEVERALNLVGAEGFATDDTRLVLSVGAAMRRRISQILHQSGIDPSRRLVIVHPGCSMPARTYPWESYAEVVEMLVRQLDCQVALTGVANEEELCRRIEDRVTVPLHSFVGLLSFREFVALIAEGDLVITNNTGPAHVSAAVQTPVVDLFALTNPPEQWGPWQVPCRVLNHPVSCGLCYSRICPRDHACLQGVAPTEVVAAASGLLSVSMGQKFVEVSRDQATAGGPIDAF
ncbi:MAG: glycosyltransferase family 9 protein [Chloroflexota bacterium]|nr:MAG: glycosyltransferase family 9 protein [Chloroflexota bacterium]